MTFLNLTGTRKVELIRQSETAECGLACIAMIASYHGHKVEMSTLRRRYNTSMKGMTLRTLIEIGNALGLGSRAVRCELEELKNVQLPAILHWMGNHFVVLSAVRSNLLTVFDPALGKRVISFSEMSKAFTGVIIEIAPTPTFKPRRQRSDFQLSSLVRIPPTIARGLIQALALSIVIELLVLTAPFYMQLVLDEAVVKGNQEILFNLALVFSMLLIFRVIAIAVRALTLQFVAQTLSFDMKTRVFHHLLRLPLEWFHKRSVGDIQSRFFAIQPIQAFVSNGAIAGFLDGTLGLIVLIVMFMYSNTLSFIAIIALLLYVTLRFFTIGLQRRFAGDLIVSQAVEQTKFLEAVRAIETLKAAGAETVRGGQQRNAIAVATNAIIRGGNIKIANDSTSVIIDGLADIAIVFFGAKYIINGGLTVGMLTAFLAYKQQFSVRLTGFVEQSVSWKMLSVDLDRLSDVTLSQQEPRVDGGSGFDSDVAGTITCKSLAYRYAFGEAFVLRNVNLTITSGDFVAIVGSSGCGKTTLLKLLVGLYRPTAGEIFVDEHPLSHWDLKSIRQQVSMVTQDDNLLSGSIAENISLFDETPDMNRVRWCAEAAQIHADILTMPMGYETLVGDLGSSLSGGQKQRVIIARALYRKPRILVMDEGTAHLDVPTERAVNDALRDLKVTRVVVAHRPETIRSANRVFRLQDGALTEERYN